MNAQLTIALLKGQIYERALQLAAAGIHTIEDPEQSRKLIIKTNHDNIRLIIVRAAYVQCGIADKEMLLEQNSKDLFQPLDLHIAKSRMMVAVRKGFNYTLASQPSSCLFMATNIDAEHFASKSAYIDLIKLHGSIKLAPLVGLFDAIADLVSCRNTLKANNLKAVEHIIDTSSYLIDNKAVLKLKYAIIQPIIDIFAQLTYLNLNNSLYQQET